LLSLAYPRAGLQVDNDAAVSIRLDDSRRQPVVVRARQILHQVALPENIAITTVGPIAGATRWGRLLARCWRRAGSILLATCWLVLPTLSLFEHLFHDGLDLWALQDFVGRGPLARVSVQQLGACLAKKL
jgi:hypothetical protein